MGLMAGCRWLLLRILWCEADADANDRAVPEQRGEGGVSFVFSFPSKCVPRPLA